MKILLVANSGWYLYNFRSTLIKEIKSKGHDLKIISPSDQYSEILIKQKNYHVQWDLSRKSINPLKEFKSILNLIIIYRKLKPDLIHHFTIKACIYGTIAAKFSNTKKVVNSITGLGHIFVGKKLKTKILKFFLLPLYRLVFNAKRSNMIFQNEDDLNEFIKSKLTNKESTCLIKGSGIDIKKFSNSNGKHLGHFHSPVRLLFPSRLIIEKGIMELLEACKFLWSENYNFELYIAGEPKDDNRSVISKEVFEEIKNNKKIKSLGHVKDMKSLFENIDIVILPSWREGLSRSLIEAAAMRKAIITSDVTGCSQIIDHGINGILVPVNDINGLILAIKLLIHNPELSRKFGERIREKVLRKFTANIINKETLKFYEIINSKSIS